MRLNHTRCGIHGGFAAKCSLVLILLLTVLWHGSLQKLVAQRPGSEGPNSKQDSHPSWPNWMGPRHDGISDETGWSAEWPDDGLEEVWSKQIGIGFSSVSIANGRLFTTGHSDGTESVFCLRVADGQPLWSHEYSSELIDNLYEGGPGATPTIDDGRVYSLGKEGQLFCLDVETGDVVWKKNLQQDLGVGLPEWGFNSSPFILGDQVILEGGRVVSYDKRTGVKKWQSEKHMAGYGSVRPIHQNGKTLLTVLDCEAVRVLKADDGTEVDSFPWKSPFGTNSTTPIVQGDTIFVSTGYQVGCALFRFEQGKLELVYENRKMRNHFNNSILLDGFLYGFDGNSNLGRVVHLTCMNHRTGEVAWKHRGLGCGSLMIADGKLLILSDDGRVVVARASSDAFEEISEATVLNGRCWTVPVLYQGHVYARNARGRLVCVRLPPTI